jgi:hypothetical protein
MPPVDELSATAVRTYVYLVKVDKPVGPRELMRGANLTSPSVAYRNLQKLMDIDLVQKDKYGNYMAKQKIGINGHVWIRKRLVPRFMIFGLVFLTALILEVAILIPHLLAAVSVEGSFWLLTIVTVVSAGIFLIEGIKWKKQSPFKQENVNPNDK